MNFCRITDTIAVCICRAVTAAHAEGVELVASAVAVTGRDCRAATSVNSARAVADAAGVESTYARIHVVADVVIVCVRRAVTTAHAEGVELVASAVAVTGRDCRAAAGVDGAGSVADAAAVEGTDAGVYVVANGIGVCITSYYRSSSIRLPGAEITT